MNKLQFSRQYVVGDRYIEEFEGWNKLEIGKKFVATIHPDLEFSQIINEHHTITLLGYLINPYKPNMSNKEIIKEISQNISNFEDLIEETYCLSGRWVLIYQSGNIIRIINDLVGFREVFYTFINGVFWCGSDPAILKHILPIKETLNEDILIYRNSNFFRKRENAWYGDKTLYEGVFHLLPNHVLDVSAKKTYRYWLNKESNKDIDDVATEAAEILKGSLIGANNRYDLMVGITAGLDSRVLIAATKDISNDIYYFVSKMDLTEKHMDIRIPSKLLPKLGLKLNILENNNAVREEIKDLLSMNISLSRDNSRNKALQYYLDFLPEKVNVNGSVSEIARGFYGFNHPIDSNITCDYLVDIVGYYGKSDYVKNELEEWLNEIRNSNLKMELGLVDLFYWEQRMGNWGSITRNEQDIANEGFMPYNNRKLMMLMTSVDPKYRKEPNFILYKLIIDKLWPETLKEPINPKTFKERTLSLIIKYTPKNIKKFVKKMAISFRGN